MEPKDFLPLIGVAAGWLLAEGTAFGKRAIERKRTIGKALSVLYFLFLEMIQLKMTQEKLKSLSNDVKEWERLRQRSFEKYTLQDNLFFERINATADSLGEYYPIEAYNLREILTKYRFAKDKKLDAFTSNPEIYISMLSSYDFGFLAYQYQLELIIRFLAFRQSKLLWIRIRYNFWNLRRRVSPEDMVFLQQTKKARRKSTSSRVSEQPDAHAQTNDAKEA